MAFDLSTNFGTREAILSEAEVKVDDLKKAVNEQDLLTKIDAEKTAIDTKLRTETDPAKIAKLKAALKELNKLEGKVSEERSGSGETDRPGRSGGRVETASKGKTPDEKLMEDPEYFKKYKQAKIRELDDLGEQRDDADTARDLTLGLTALNAGAGIIGGGGGQFVSTASSGPGGSYFGTASGSGGGFGVAPFGAPGFVGIASGGFGGPNPSGAMGPGDVLFNIGAPMMTSGANGLGEEIRQQNRKLEALINFLLLQILSGNTDAITSALIAVSRKSKGTLILSSVGMISAMKQYDQQQAKISETFQNLQFDAGNPDSMAKFQHQSQNLSMQLNGIAVARQMLMNQMRDVLTMSEEIGNVEKSILDIVGQFKRHYSRFNV